MLSRDSDAARVRFPPPLVYALSLGAGWLVETFAFTLGVPMPSEMWRFTTAAVPGAAGLAMLAYAAGLFVRSGQNPEPWKTTPSMVVSGIYRWTRNPMYVGMALVQVGIGIWLNNLWMVLLTAASLWCVYRIAVMPEEAYLEEKFGDEYRRYKQAVRRWL